MNYVKLSNINEIIKAFNNKCLYIKAYEDDEKKRLVGPDNRAWLLFREKVEFYILKHPQCNSSCGNWENREACTDCFPDYKKFTPKQRQPQLCRGCINLERKFADECRNCSRHLSIGKMNVN
jgi:hypothetical protein